MIKAEQNTKQGFKMHKDFTSDDVNYQENDYIALPDNYKCLGNMLWHNDLLVAIISEEGNLVIQDEGIVNANNLPALSRFLQMRVD